MMYTVSPELYHEVATRLMDAIDGGNYFSGSIVFEFEGAECRLTSSIVVYREHVSRPDGDVHAISDLVPVWWEFHTTGSEGEFANDFSFRELKSFL